MSVAQAEHFGLPRQYAAGYADSYVGVRTVAVEAYELAALVEALIPAIVELWDKLKGSF